LSDGMFSEMVVSCSIGIGVLLLWIASLVATFGGYSDAKATTALVNTGLALISTMLICGGVANSKIERQVKIAMVVMGAIVLLVFLILIQGYGYLL
jgi:hypothetical protein